MWIIEVTFEMSSQPFIFKYDDEVTLTPIFSHHELGKNPHFMLGYIQYTTTIHFPMI
jgi:hypothetical protein